MCMRASSDWQASFLWIDITDRKRTLLSRLPTLAGGTPLSGSRLPRLNKLLFKNQVLPLYCSPAGKLIASRCETLLLCSRGCATEGLMRLGIRAYDAHPTHRRVAKLA